MIYCFNDKFLIRAMGAADPQTLCDEEIAQGWHSSADKFKRRIADSERGKAIALVAEYEGNAIYKCISKFRKRPVCQYGLLLDR